uniref:Leucine rich repeat neuronal 4 n=1 Tax=Varanus komodoensis TaxID=61221 RepID=A0A8D2JHZ5_VARKO
NEYLAILRIVFLLLSSFWKQEPSLHGRSFFHLVKQNTWEENASLTNLSCEELRNQAWTTLHLKNQNLTSFPVCLPEFLEHLDLSVNLLPQLHSQDVAYLPRLQVLTLKHNQIQEVTWGAWSLSSLQALDLSFNLLSSVPACTASSSLASLRWLSLAGNPIAEIQPLAFSCFPRLLFLNLSSTWLGRDGQGGISESAFAMNLRHVGDSTRKPGSALSVLDLSATFLERIHQGWIKNLPGLTSLYLTRMRQLRSLDADIFPHVPTLRELDCRDSQALTLVHTESFNHIPHVALLLFQNCNLSSFSPWNLRSSGNLVINLYGNPLVCHCDISWLFAKPGKIVLQRASETMCFPSPGESVAPLSGPLPLPELYNACQGQRTQELTKAAILADREETVHGSADHPWTLAAVGTTPSTTLETSAGQPFISMVHLDPGKQDATTVNSMDSPEETQYHTVVLTPTTEAPGTSPSQAPSGLFIPHIMAHSEQTTRPLQNTTKAVSLPHLATSDHPVHYEDDDDYEIEQEDSAMEMLQFCDYDPCRHLQKPCPDLQVLSPCLCPGISNDFTIPEPPRLHRVSEIRDTSAEIHWCAPSSAVRFYQLAYHPKDSKMNDTLSGEIYATARRYTLYNLLPGSTYQVCVIASNEAGSSRTAEWDANSTPCSTFATQSSYKPPLVALCATSAFFLTATILLSVCLCKKHRTPHSEQHGTRLVSYKNPAFDYSLK